jgi:hypothetical protein
MFLNSRQNFIAAKPKHDWREIWRWQAPGQRRPKRRSNLSHR